MSTSKSNTSGSRCDSPASDQRRFHTTHWSLVVEAGGDSTPAARQALAELCQDYWYPLYAYIRRKGHAADVAQDMTQAFFVHLLEHDTIRVAEPSRGRFRSFLLTSLNHFMANTWRHAQAEKRGGGRSPLSLDLVDGERRFTLEPVDRTTAEDIYLRRWAMTILNQAVERLREEYEAANKLDVFELLKDTLAGSRTATSYAEIAGQLQTTEGAIKVAAFRLRKRCRELLRQQVARTVGSTAGVDEEIRDLFQALAGS